LNLISQKKTRLQKYQKLLQVELQLHSAMPKFSKLTQLNVLHVLNDGFLVSLPLLLPFLQKDLGLSLTQIGFLGTALKSFEVILALPAGHLAEKFGSLRLLLFAIFVYAAGYLFAGFSMNIFFLTIAFLLAGIGFGVFHPVAFSLVDSWSKSKHKGRNMGNFTAIGDIGRLAIASAVTLIAGYVGWRFASLLYGSLAMGLFVLFMLIIGPKKDNHQEVEVQETNNKTFSFLRRKYVLVTLTGFLDSLSSSALFVFIPFLLILRGASVDYLGSLTAMFFVGNMVGKIGMGRMVDMFGNKKIFFWAEIIMAICLLAITQFPSILVIALISIILGALTKGTVPVIMTMVSQSLEHGDSRQKAYGFNAFIVGMATTSAPFLLGITSDRFGIQAAFYLSAAVAIVATMPVLATKKLKL
jgi:MFS family permease